jgi:hypothetical protein
VGGAVGFAKAKGTSATTGSASYGTSASTAAVQIGTPTITLGHP